MGLTDAFRMFDQPEKSFSWWDYRMLGFQKNRGLRIDHILVSPALKARTHGLRGRPRSAQKQATQRPRPRGRHPGLSPSTSRCTSGFFVRCRWQQHAVLHWFCRAPFYAPHNAALRQPGFLPF